MAAFVRLAFAGGWDARDDFEAPRKGWRDAHVELDDGSRYRVTFYDVVRLAQTLEDERRAGRAFLGEPGLIVLDEVTRSKMEDAAARLAREGFFDSLRPIEP